MGGLAGGGKTPKAPPPPAPAPPSPKQVAEAVPAGEGNTNVQTRRKTTKRKGSSGATVLNPSSTDNLLG